MIKINELSYFKKKEYGEKIIKKIKHNYQIILEREVDKSKEYNEIMQKIMNNLEIIIMGNINEVIQKYNEIQEATDKPYLRSINIKNDIFNETDKKINSDFNVYIKQIFNYEKIIRDLGYELAIELDVQVCPYCNRNYTTTVYGKRGKTRNEFDHFFPKGLYPLLALSLSNLIPACHTCNHIKSEKYFSIEDNLHPYSEGVNEKIFSYFYDISIDNASIKILKDKNKKFKNNMEYLMLDKIYLKAHNSVVNNILNRYYVLNYVMEEINSLNGISKISLQEMKSILGYSEEISKSSLGKLKNDIIDEIFDLAKKY